MTTATSTHNFTESVTKNGQRVVCCQECGYWHAHPMPTQEELDRYYKEKYYKTLEGNRSMTDKQKDPDGFYEIQYEDRLRRILPLMAQSQPLSVIDLGAGYGDFLSFMKRKGWRVSGLEPSRETYEQIQNEGLGIVSGNVEEKFESFEPAGLVTINNVLEHVRNPDRILAIIRDHLLAPGGIVSILVPNDFSSLQDVILKTTHADQPEKQHYWVAPPDHLSYWSTETIGPFLKRCGFEVLSLSMDFPIELFLLMGDDYVTRPETGRPSHLRRVQLEKNLRKAGREDLKDSLFGAFAAAGLGRVMQVIARPVKKS